MAVAANSKQKQQRATTKTTPQLNAIGKENIGIQSEEQQTIRSDFISQKYGLGWMSEETCYEVELAGEHILFDMEILQLYEIYSTHF